MRADPPKRDAKKKEEMDEYLPQESYLALTPGRLREKVANLSMQLQNEKFDSRERGKTELIPSRGECLECGV